MDTESPGSNSSLALKLHGTDMTPRFVSYDFVK